MHEVSIREHVVARVLARRGRVHLFDSLDPKRTALVIIDMINMFVEPGAPAEVPASRGIVANINALTGGKDHRIGAGAADVGGNDGTHGHSDALSRGRTGCC